MQPSPPPPTPPLPRPRSPLGLFLALGVLALVAAAGVGGYLVGASGVGHATLRVQVTNNLGNNVTAQVTVNGALAGDLPIAAGQTASMDVPVSFAAASGSAFQVDGSTAAGPHDSTTVLVNSAGTFIVSLRLG
jgi:hypothetical protein